jgi:hypothetical protein
MSFGEARVATLDPRREQTLRQGIIAYLGSCPSGELRQVRDTAETLCGRRYGYTPGPDALTYPDPDYQDVWALMNVMADEGVIRYRSHRGWTHS